MKNHQSVIIIILMIVLTIFTFGYIVGRQSEHEKVIQVSKDMYELGFKDGVKSTK